MFGFGRNKKDVEAQVSANDLHGDERVLSWRQ